MTTEELQQSILEVAVQYRKLLGHLPAREDEEFLMDAAKTRMLELSTIVSAISGKGKAWHQRIIPLMRAVNDVMHMLDVHNCEPIVEDEHLAENMMERDEVDALLNQARVQALCMFAALNEACSKIPQLKAVK